MKTETTMTQIVAKMCSAISCGVCGTRVTKAVAYESGGGRYRFVAECHGDSESCLVDVLAMFSTKTTVMKAVAFPPRAERCA